jgi:hypothetical protein
VVPSKVFFFLFCTWAEKVGHPLLEGEYLRMAYTMLNGSQFYDNYSTALYVDKFAFVIPLKTYNCEHEWTAYLNLWFIYHEVTNFLDQ